MFEYLQRREVAARRAVDTLADLDVLEGDQEQLVQQLFDEVGLHPIDLLWDQMYQDKPRETSITMRDPGFNEVFTGRGTALVVHVPFTGDSALFGVAPTSFTLNPPRGSVRSSEVLLEWQGRFAHPAQVKAWLTELRKQLESYADWSKRDCDGFNATLRGQLAAWLNDRKAQLEKNAALASALEIPIGRKPSPSTVLIPVPKRRPIPVRKAGAERGNARPQLSIAEDEYVAIIEHLTSARGLLERMPETFSAMGEEALRDLMLVILNNEFGPAVGEMFSRKGKTDIVILGDGGPVFIAECKIWSGEKAFVEAINQLLGYLVWRDTKAAMVVFLRERDVSGITKKAQVALAGHPRHVAPGAPIGDVLTEILHHEGDQRRHIRVALLVVPVAPVK